MSLIVFLGDEGGWEVRDDGNNTVLFTSADQNSALEFAVTVAISRMSDVILFVKEHEYGGLHRLH